MPLKLADEVEARLAQLGYQNDLSSWELGDLSTWIFELLTRVIDDKRVLIDPTTEEIMPSRVLYNEIGKHAGKSPHSIRDYHHTSKNIPPSIRQEFHMIGRHHWKALIPHCDTVEDLRWWGDKILEWAVDYNGQIITVAALRAKLSEKKNKHVRRWERPYRLACNNLEKMLKNKPPDTAPLHLQLAAENFLKASVPLP